MPAVPVSLLREELVPKPFRCVSCTHPLEPVQELRFLVESENLENPAYLASIRRLPTVKGRPIPVCKTCQAQIDSTHHRPTASRPSAVLAVVGILSVGWFLQTLLTGPRA